MGARLLALALGLQLLTACLAISMKKTFPENSKLNPTYEMDDYELAEGMRFTGTVTHVQDKKSWTAGAEKEGSKESSSTSQARAAPTSNTQATHAHSASAASSGDIDEVVTDDDVPDDGKSLPEKLESQATTTQERIAKFNDQQKADLGVQYPGKYHESQLNKWRYVGLYMSSPVESYFALCVDIMVPVGPINLIIGVRGPTQTNNESHNFVGWL